MIKVALIGAGKMGISHLSILGAHPEIEIVGVADPSSIVTDILNKYTTFTTFSDYKIMLGKPVIKGTRITVELLLRKLSEGVSVKEILSMYNKLKKKDIYAALTYASEVIGKEEILVAKK